MTVLPDGRLITGSNGVIMLWDPRSSDHSPVVLGDCAQFGRDSHNGIRAVAAMSGGYLATAGPSGVLLWDLAEPGMLVDRLYCEVRDLAPLQSTQGPCVGFTGYMVGLSLWSVKRLPFAAAA